MKTVLKYTIPYISRALFGLVIKIIGTMVDLVIPWLLGYIIDNVIPQKNINSVFIYGGAMVICSFIGVIGNILANRMASQIARDVTRDIRHGLFSKIESLSFSQIDEVTIPSLISRMTSDTYNIHQMIGMIQRIGVRAPILLVGGIIVTLTLDPILTCILLLTLPLVAALSIIVTKAGVPLFKSVQTSIDNMVRAIRENASGARVIRALSKAEYEKNRFNKINSEILNYEIKAGYNMTRLNPFVNLFLNTGLVIVIIVGAFRVNTNLSSSGDVVSFTTYFTTILNAMLSITRIFVVLTRSSASAARIEYVLKLKPELELVNIEKEKSEYEIEFRNVSFSYNKKINNLENINFKLKKSESLGIIGSTGSGKSTIINLLMRFYDCDGGQILINGEDVRSIEPIRLKRKFGVVFQNDTIFNDTIFENINFERNLDFDDVVKASKYAQAYDFINQLPDKFNTVLSPKGTNLSGGQKQRLLIARSLAAKPDILILDDASSALDYKTDANLRNEINKNFNDTTQIIVAQRISSIMYCDYIMVLEEGHVVGYGKHDELLNTVDVYKEIYDSQMGGEIDE